MKKIVLLILCSGMMYGQSIRGYKHIDADSLLKKVNGILSPVLSTSENSVIFQGKSVSTPAQVDAAVIGVEAYGASGTATASANSTAIQNAISAASSGQTVRFLSGSTYSIASTIVVNKPITLDLQGALLVGTSSSLIHITASNATVCGSEGMAAIYQDSTLNLGIKIDPGLSHIKISGLNFVHPSDTIMYTGNGRSLGSGIQVAGTLSSPDSDITVTDCSFDGQNIGVLFAYTDNSKVTNCTFDWTNSGWMMVNLYVTRNCVVSGNTFVSTGYNANAVEAIGNDTLRLSYGNVISNNAIAGDFRYEGINLINESWNTISDNTICMTDTVPTDPVCGIAIGTGAEVGAWPSYSIAHDNVVSGNTIISSGLTGGVHVGNQSTTYKASRNTIIGNSISCTGANGNGITIDSYCDENSIIANTISAAGTSARGIYVGNATGTKISLNRIRNVADAGIYLNHGDRAEVTHNRISLTGQQAILVGGGNSFQIEFNQLDTCAHSIYVAAGTPSILAMSNTLDSSTPAIDWGGAVLLDPISAFHDTTAFGKVATFYHGIIARCTGAENNFLLGPTLFGLQGVDGSQLQIAGNGTDSVTYMHKSGPHGKIVLSNDGYANVSAWEMYTKLFHHYGPMTVDGVLKLNGGADTAATKADVRNGGGSGSVAFSSITGNATDNASLAAALGGKRDSAGVATTANTNAARNYDSLRAIAREGLKLAITDSTSFHNQFGLKLNIADTVSFHNQLALKQNSLSSGSNDGTFLAHDLAWRTPATGSSLNATDTLFLGNILNNGGRNDSTYDSAPFVQTMVNSATQGVKQITFPAGKYLWGTKVRVGRDHPYVNFVFEPGCIIYVPSAWTDTAIILNSPHCSVDGLVIKPIGPWHAAHTYGYTAVALVSDTSNFDSDYSGVFACTVKNYEIWFAKTGVLLATVQNGFVNGNTIRDGWTFYTDSPVKERQSATSRGLGENVFLNLNFQAKYAWGSDTHVGVCIFDSLCGAGDQFIGCNPWDYEYSASQPFVSTITSAATYTHFSSGWWNFTIIDNGTNTLWDDIFHRAQGVQLILNGGFSSTTDGWFGSANAAIASVAGGQSGNCMQVTNSGGTYQYAYQCLPVVAGVDYTFTCYAMRANSSSGQTAEVVLGTTVGGLDIYDSGQVNPSGWTQYTYSFKAPSSRLYVSLYANGVNGNAAIFDGISLVRADGAQAASVYAQKSDSTGYLLTKTQGLLRNFGTLGYSAANAFSTQQQSVNSYAQFVISNTSTGSTASTDYVVNNSLSTDTSYYGDMGMNSSGFTGSGAFNQPNNVYFVSKNADMAIGTMTANGIHFVINSGTTDAMAISSTGVVTIGGSNAIKATDTTSFANQFALKAPLVSPSFTTPTLGAATATTINKVTITAPAPSATLTLAQGSSIITSGAYAGTFTFTNTTGVTFPTSGTLLSSAAAVTTAQGGTGRTANPWYKAERFSPATADTVFIANIIWPTIDSICYSSDRGKLLQARIEMVDSLYQTAAGTLIDTTSVAYQRQKKTAASAGCTFTLTAYRILRLIFPSVGSSPREFIATIFAH